MDNNRTKDNISEPKSSLRKWVGMYAEVLAQYMLNYSNKHIMK